MNLNCPKCHSTRIGAKNVGRKTGAVIGTVAGAASGMSDILRRVPPDWAKAPFALTPTAPYSTIASAILGGLFGGAAGCAVGATLGEAVDEQILDNWQCLACGYAFSQQRS